MKGTTSTLVLISVGGRSGRHRAGLALLRRQARHGRRRRRRVRSGPTGWSTTSTSWTKPTTRAIVHPIRDGSTPVLWKGVDVGVIDGLVNGIGLGGAGHRRRAAADAIRLHPELRGLGRAGRAWRSSWSSAPDGRCEVNTPRHRPASSRPSAS